MTGALHAFMAAGVGHMQTVNGEIFTLRDQSLVGIVSDLTQQTPWGSNEGGVKQEKRLRIVFPITVFSPPLRIGETVRVRGELLKVSAISSDPTQITINCVEKLGN